MCSHLQTLCELPAFYVKGNLLGYLFAKSTMLGKFFPIPKMTRHQDCYNHHQYAQEEYPFVAKGQYVIDKVIHFIKSNLPIIP